MKRDLTVERRYNFGDFNHLHVIDSMIEIPDGLNQKLVEEVNYLQLLTIETLYQRYVDFVKRASKVQQEEVMNLLEQERREAFEKIQNLLYKKEE